MTEQNTRALRYLPICEPCIAGEGSECHTPECALFMRDVPEQGLIEAFAVDELIEASSLGTPAAKAARASVSDEAARRVVDRADAHVDDHRVAETRPAAVTIHAEGRTLLTIHGDGRVEAGGLDDASEAAQVFVREVTKMMPGRIRDDVAARLDDVRALHRPWYEIDGVRHDHLIPIHTSELPEGHVCRVGGTLDSCRPADEEHLVLACVECRQTTEDAVPGVLLWPCPTAELAGATRG